MSPQFTSVHSQVHYGHTGDYIAQVWNDLGGVDIRVAELTVVQAGLTIGLIPRLTVEGVPGRTYLIQDCTTADGSTGWQTITNITLRQESEQWHDNRFPVESGVRPELYYRVLMVP